MRVLVVLSAASLVDGIRTRCFRAVGERHEVAVCYVLEPHATHERALQMQRKVTAELRQALESAAEAIPVFVVSGGDGDGVDDCARAWGATYVDA